MLLIIQNSTEHLAYRMRILCSNPLSAWAIKNMVITFYLHAKSACFPSGVSLPNGTTTVYAAGELLLR